MNKGTMNSREVQYQTPKSRIPLLRRSNSMRLPMDSARTPTNTMRDCLPRSCEEPNLPCSTLPAGRSPICRNPFASGKRSLSFADGTSYRRQPEVSLPHSARAVTPLGMYLGREAEASMTRSGGHLGDDVDSLRSFGASSICSSVGSTDHWGVTPMGHPSRFAKNGTTYSGRQKRYVMHCSPHLENNEETYLTPTQRAVRQIRKLKVVLNQAKKEIEMRDAEIERLKKELMELRHNRERGDMNHNSSASGHQDEDMNIGYLGSDVGDYGDRHDDVEVLVGVLADMDRVLEDDDAIRMANRRVEERLERMGTHDPPSSLADSGHYEDLVSSSSVQSKESLRLSPGGEEDFVGGKTLLEEEPEDEGRTRREEMDSEIQREQRRSAQAIVDLKDSHRAELKELRFRLNEAEEKVESLQKELDGWKSRVDAAEHSAEEAKKAKEEIEHKDLEKQEALLLKMYQKGQEAARFEHADQVLEFAHKAPSRVSVPELLQQLQDTEAKLEEMKDKESTWPRFCSVRPIVNTKHLLSGSQAIALWNLSRRKIMYRRALEEMKRIENQQNTAPINDPTITLQFLKTAVYYFLTDRVENTYDHLSAIESILGFSEQEKSAIEKANPNLTRK